MRSHLDKDNKELIVARVRNLKPNSSPSWGNMTVNDMLFHCNKINNEVMQAKPSSSSPTFKQKLIKLVALHFMKGFPKGIQTGTKYLPAPTDALNFETLKNEVIQSIEYIATYPDAIHGKHPFLGSLNTQEWRRFFWMHMDHHLRQFHV